MGDRVNCLGLGQVYGTTKGNRRKGEEASNLLIRRLGISILALN